MPSTCLVAPGKTRDQRDEPVAVRAVVLEGRFAHVDAAHDERLEGLLKRPHRWALQHRGEDVGRVAARCQLSGDQVTAGTGFLHGRERAAVLDRPCTTAESVADDEAAVAGLGRPGDDE